LGSPKARLGSVPIRTCLRNIPNSVKPNLSGFFATRWIGV
jgi:hypothetical protein